MKKILALCLFILAISLSAGEVIFVPGWLTGKSSQADYEQQLKLLYPNDKLTIMFWDSTVTWKKALENADAFAPEIVKYISAMSEEDRAGLILIGHSLGGRIIAKASTGLTGNKLKVKQIILLGAALDFDADLSAIPASVTDKGINVFSQNDGILKYLYGNVQKKFALGFCGADMEKKPKEKFEEYRFQMADIIQSNISDEQALKDAANHYAKIYLNELKKILDGKGELYKAKYDYSKIQIKKNNLSIPENWIIPPVTQMKVIDSYADWAFVTIDVKFHKTDKKGNKKEYSKAVYFVIDNYGRIVMWNLFKSPLQKEFNRLKKEIVAL